MTHNSNIRILGDVLADQIAAGEVVERPSSVVKELIENAVDAGATEIHVAIADGGRTLIRISDNGAGMGREDAALCIKRHATSKLRTQEDLFAIDTLGFRGEALPSIASVARLCITTRPANDAEGTRVEVVGGEVREVAPTGCAPGTTVEVTELFKNVPARLKFLKATATESGHVAGICTRIALIHPELRLTLVRDGRKAREFLPASTFADRVGEVFPGELLNTFQIAAGPLHATAVLGAPERARSGATGLHIFVNGRPVRDISLARSISFAYGSVLPPGRFPLGAVDIRVPPSDIDVNVHPQKTEVRFKDGRALLQTLTRDLAQQLGTTAFRGPASRTKSYWDTRLSPGPRIADRPEPSSGLFEAHPRPNRAPFSEEIPDRARHADEQSVEASGPSRAQPTFVSSTGQPIAKTESSPLAAVFPNARPTATATAFSSESADPPPTPSEPGSTQPDTDGAMPSHFYSSLRVLGQAKHMLLVCEAQDGLYIIDQHAADERVRYAQFRAQHKTATVKTQQLLFPERIACTESEVALLEAHQDEIGRLGLECRALSATTVAVHCIPVLLAKAAPEQLVRDLLAEIAGHGDRVFSDAIDMALATMACHAAIRAGDALSNEQAKALLCNLDQVEDFGGHCPHGRPVAQHIPFSELERSLGR